MSDRKASFDDILNFILEPNSSYTSFIHSEAPSVIKVSDEKLTAEDVMEAVDYIKKQSDEYWSNLYANTCGLGRPHVISPTVYKNGGVTLCSNCFEPLKVEPHE